MRIVITEFMDESAVDRLSGRFETIYDPGLVDQPLRLTAELEDAVALIVRNRTRVTGELLAHAPRLRVVGRLGVGLDNIDLAACGARAIEVIPATGANARAVAEYVVCAAMMLLRGTFLASDRVGTGAWPRASLANGRELAGKTLGVVGFGAIGQLTARLARALGVTIATHDPVISARAPIVRELDVTLMELEALLAAADIVSLHVPLTDKTRRLFDRGRLAAMKRGAILINTARGGIVDEGALADLLKSGHLGGAALDVFEREPLPIGTPLAEAPNLVLTPHIAGVTAESNRRVSHMIADTVAEFLSRL